VKQSAARTLPSLRQDSAKYPLFSVKDSKAAFRITDAVAFGDLRLSATVQAADAGIGLAPRDEAASEPRSASAAEAERRFLGQLRGRRRF
jgi:hypothetical protein